MPLRSSTMNTSKLIKSSLLSVCPPIISRLAWISASHLKILTNMYNAQGRHWQLIILPDRPRKILAIPLFWLLQNGIICLIVNSPCRWSLILGGDEELPEWGDTRDNNRYQVKVSNTTTTWWKLERTKLQKHSQSIFIWRSYVISTATRITAVTIMKIVAEKMLSRMSFLRSEIRVLHNTRKGIERTKTRNFVSSK